MILDNEDGSNRFWTMNVTSRVCDHLFTGSAASLTNARLVKLYHIYTPPLTGLTYLQLGGSFHSTQIVKIAANDLCHLLTASPSLIDLVLYHLDIVFPLNTSISDIQIPSLCSLTISFLTRTLKLFSLLSLPKLETLTLAHISRFGEPFINIGSQSYATVTALKLVKCGHIHHSLAKSLYSSFPSIIHLDLIESSGLILDQPHAQSDCDLAIIWRHLKAITISYPVTYQTICDAINDHREMGHSLGVVNVWSCIRQQIEVLELDNESKSNFQYPEGLKSGIEEVQDEEWDEEQLYNEERGSDFDRYGLDSD